MKKIFIMLTCVLFFSVSAFSADLPVLKSKADLASIAKKYSGKTMVVFWAPWCPHCMRELRMLRDNPAFIKKNRIQVIGMVKENDASSAADTIKDEKFPFKFFAGTKDLYSEMMKIDAVPYTVIFGNKGNIIDFEYGEQKTDELELMLK